MNKAMIENKKDFFCVHKALMESVDALNKAAFSMERIQNKKAIQARDLLIEAASESFDIAKTILKEENPNG